MGNQPLRVTAVLAATLALATSGCIAQSPPPPSVPLHPAASAPSTASGEETTSAATSSSSGSASASSKVSAKALDYAKKLGGWDHKGQTLYFIIGGGYGSEAEAQTALDKALPSFGDMQPYFIVQRADSFTGMTGGPWVVVEAHFKEPSEENLDFARRGFPDARVERAKVAVKSPIPVYEDIVGGD